MKLDLEIKLDNNISQNKETANFIQKLENTIIKSDISTYKDDDERHFTNENDDKIWQKENELVEESITINNIEGAEKDKLYEVTYKVHGGVGVIEYTDSRDNRKLITVPESELQENIKEGTFFRKINNSFVLDKETTNKLYEEMKEYKNNLYDEQQIVLKEMRKEGAIYKITHLEDDCEDWRTTLTNQETGEVFQELEFPHDVYHQVGVNSLVTFKNGKYSVIEGTSVYDLYPSQIENYCEIEGVYITKDGKYETADELYESLDNNKKINGLDSRNFIMGNLKKIIDKIVAIAKGLLKVD